MLALRLIFVPAYLDWCLYIRVMEMLISHGLSWLPGPTRVFKTGEAKLHFTLPLVGVMWNKHCF